MLLSLGTIACITKPPAMININGLLLKNCKVTARTEMQPPVGSINAEKRPLGFATIFLDLENTQNVAQQVTIDHIEVQDDRGRVQWAQMQPQVMTIQPLEYRANDFHLKQSGSLSRGKVKAVVYYQMGTARGQLVSDWVAIEQIGE